MRVVCEELSADDLYKIMKFSEGSILRQYERAFRAYGIEISFEDEALRLMAEAAAKEKTGARGLLTVWEKLFRDYKYYLAGSGLTQLRVSDRTGARTATRARAFDGGRSQAGRSRARAEARESSPNDFQREHGVRDSASTTAAIAAAWSSAPQAERMTMPDLCAHLFKDYQFGLSLVQKNTGQNVFRSCRAKRSMRRINS